MYYDTDEWLQFGGGRGSYHQLPQRIGRSRQIILTGAVTRQGGCYQQTITCIRADNMVFVFRFRASQFSIISDCLDSYTERVWHNFASWHPFMIPTEQGAFQSGRLPEQPEHERFPCGSSSQEKRQQNKRVDRVLRSIWWVLATPRHYQDRLLWH